MAYDLWPSLKTNLTSDQVAILCNEFQKHTCETIDKPSGANDLNDVSTMYNPCYRYNFNKNQ